MLNQYWKKDAFWTTMIWNRRRLGLKLENVGTVNKPKIRLIVFSTTSLQKKFVENLISEIRYRFNFDQDISKFCRRFEHDEILGPVIKRWRGMKPVAFYSLYETLVVYIVLQNATIKRSVQMMEKLFHRFGEKLKFDGKVLFSFWEPVDVLESSEDELRKLKLGYRARFLTKISEQFTRGIVDEFSLRKKPKKEIKKEMLKLYGIGPASVEYLLFEYFYFLDELESLPPWEQKIMSRLIFKEPLVQKEKIISFFKRFEGYEKLAFHYLWEDLFWKRKTQRIEWLEKEIRL
jgi:3-methyladenine DNA glycosylase/8-oxoguanine DNA glycosylase